jgi:hypothetical protein
MNDRPNRDGRIPTVHLSYLAFSVRLIPGGRSRQGPAA